MINVAELINDPDFCQPGGINITRTKQSIKNHSVVETKSKIKVKGIITISSGNDNLLLPEANKNEEAINIFTYDRLKVVGADRVDGISYGSDIVHFEGVDYIVRYCMNDAQYGFCKSIATKMRTDVM